MDTIGHLPSLAPAPLWVLFAALALVVFQEAVNGFHDTANAVATVIYSNSLNPMPAVAIAALGNFLGVLIGGTAVAFTLVYMLPKEMVAGIDTAWEASLLLALVLSAISWNLGTWWLGIPNSTTHTYVGSIIGVAIAHALLIGAPIAEQVNLHKARDIFITLIISPVIGFTIAWLLMKLLRKFVTSPDMYLPAQGQTRPPGWVRALLISGSAGVSLLHGSNDGQKSIGLMMLVLFAIAPTLYGLNPNRLNTEDFQQGIHIINDLEATVGEFVTHAEVGARARDMLQEAQKVQALMHRQQSEGGLSGQESVELRYLILDMHQKLERVMKNSERLALLTPAQEKTLEHTYQTMGNFIQGVPFWIILLSATALGLGTAIGYKKIVKTLGEKMGSAHMNPAQGTAAQIAAIIGIGMADSGGMPISTTHVLAAGVAGTVAATPDETVNVTTLRRIAITWVTTLPGCVILSFTLAIIFNLTLV